MIEIKIEDHNPPLGWVHLASDYYVSETPFFRDEDIVAKSEYDEDNLFIKEFDIVLDPNKTYYSKVRAIYDKGYSTSIINSFKPKDLEENILKVDIPGVVSTPTISHSYRIDRFPINGFTINVSGFASTGSGQLLGVNYILEDIDGKVYDSDLDNREDLKFKKFDVLLPHDKVFRLKISFISSSNDVSEFSVLTFKTKKITDIGPIIITDLSRLYPNTDVNVAISDVNRLVKVEWVLKREGEIIWTSETEGIRNTIPFDMFPENTKGVLEVRTTTVEDVSDWTSKEYKVIDTLPSELPYNVSY